MIEFSRIGRAIGLTIGAAAALAGVGTVAALRRPLPRTSGRVTLRGLGAKAEVRRDRWGVPHISAATTSDLFTALGYVHAQDRLWQMELNRRTGHGRLAEIFGPIALSSDQFIRTLGFSRIAREEAELLDEPTRAVIDAYLRGINSFVEEQRGRLPLEFTILGFQPRPWEPADIMVWAKMMALNLSANWTNELFNARIVAALGAERAAELTPHYPEDGLITVPSGVRYDPQIGEAALRLAADAAPFTGDSDAPQGSNAWAVSGARTASGKPLLSGDPHLGLALPGIWYTAHLHSPDYHAIGATMPGTCGVVIGHNDRIAWSVTNAMTDNQDLFIERFHPEDRLRYAYQNEWRQAKLVREEISVKGQSAPTVVEVRVTHHGPIIDDIAGPIGADGKQPAARSAPHEALSLRWTALDSHPSLHRSVLALARAQTWDEFRAALADWDVPPQNFVYADTAGTIGYQLAGRLPIRPGGDGQLPVPGWTGEHEWQGCIPFDELPSHHNPPDGAVVTANNRIADEGHITHGRIQGEWWPPYRADRIRQLIEATPQHDVRSFAQIQNDLHALPGARLAQIIADLPLEDGLERRARDLLATWDGKLSADSVGGAIYDTLRYHLVRGVYAELDALPGTAAGMGAFGSIPANSYLERAFPNVLSRLAAAQAPDRADPWLGGERTWNEVLREALARAVADLRKLGSDPARWSYGRYHTLTLRHPLGGVPALAPIFNRGPWPTGGDGDTVNMGYLPRDTAAGPSYTGPSYRQILDLSDWDAARSILPAGQSGHPASPHYSSMADAWRAGGYHPLLWTREAIERHTAGVLTLEPG